MVAFKDELKRHVAQGSRRKMKNALAVLMGALMSTACVAPAAMAQPACVTSSAVVPAGANTTDRSQPFFIDPSQTVAGDKSNLVVSTSHPGTWTRTVDVYVPAQYVRGTEVPFIVLGDGGSTAYKDLVAILDNLIQQRRVPPLIAIQIGNGGQDAQGSERGREYDTVSGTYTQFVEREVLPLVEQGAGAKLTKNPDGRAALGLSSSGAASFTMAWFHPELYRRVLAYSPTLVNQQWPYDPSL